MKPQQPAPLGRQLYSIKEAAYVLNVTPWLVYKLADDGVLASVYQGRRRYIKADSLDAYVASLPTEKPASA
jgi:excisionase family DNA binding protein